MLQSVLLAQVAEGWNGSSGDFGIQCERCKAATLQGVVLQLHSLHLLPNHNFVKDRHFGSGERSFHETEAMLVVLKHRVVILRSIGQEGR